MSCKREWTTEEEKRVLEIMKELRCLLLCTCSGGALPEMRIVLESASMKVGSTQRVHAIYIEDGVETPADDVIFVGDFLSLNVEGDEVRAILAGNGSVLAYSPRYGLHQTVSIIVEEADPYYEIVVSGPSEVREGATVLLEPMLLRDGVPVPDAQIVAYRGTAPWSPGEFVATEEGTYKFTFEHADSGTEATHVLLVLPGFRLHVDYKSLVMTEGTNQVVKATLFEGEEERENAHIEWAVKGPLDLETDGNVAVVTAIAPGQGVLSIFAANQQHHLELTINEVPKRRVIEITLDPSTGWEQEVGEVVDLRVTGGVAEDEDGNRSPATEEELLHAGLNVGYSGGYAIPTQIDPLTVEVYGRLAGRTRIDLRLREKLVAQRWVTVVRPESIEEPEDPIEDPTEPEDPIEVPEDPDPVEEPEDPVEDPDTRRYLWLSPAEIAKLPAEGPAWDNLLKQANKDCGTPDLADQSQNNNVCVMAAALAYAKQGDEKHLKKVTSAIKSIADSGKYVGRALALGRELAAYIISADLINLREVDVDLDERFRAKLRELRTTPTSGAADNLIDCHEKRPNNWGTMAGASRVAIAAYLGDEEDLARAAEVFRGYLGDRRAYAGFKYGDDLSWQADPARPVGINPVGAKKQGLDIDGVLPEEMRRGGEFGGVAFKENYVWEALQGAYTQAYLLHRQGYSDVFLWSDYALLRATEWLHNVAEFPAEGDDQWLPHLINHVYNTDFPAPLPARAGKIAGWTDWSHPKRNDPEDPSGGDPEEPTEPRKTYAQRFFEYDGELRDLYPADNPSFFRGRQIAELPLCWDTTYEPPPRERVVFSNGNIRTAMDAAVQMGGNCWVVIPDGVHEEQGGITVPDNDGDWIYVVSQSVWDNILPKAPGQRIHYRNDKSNMAIIRCMGGKNASALRIMRGQKWRFVGVYFEPDPKDTSFTTTLVDVKKEATYIIFDRCVAAGSAFTPEGVARQNVGRGFTLHGYFNALIDSGTHQLGAQGGQGSDRGSFSCFNGRGYYKIVNNYLESGGINILLGGAQSDYVEHDFEIRQNHFFKDPRYGTRGVTEEEAFIGARFTNKNHFETKRGVRILFEGNVLENSWTDAQTGGSILLKSTCENEDKDLNRCGHITIRYNRTERCEAPFATSAMEGSKRYPAHPLHNVHVHDNLFEAKYFTDSGQGRQFSWGANDSSDHTGTPYRGFGPWVFNNNSFYVHYLPGGSLKTNEQMRFGLQDLTAPGNEKGYVVDNVFFRASYGGVMLASHDDGTWQAASEKRGWEVSGNVVWETTWMQPRLFTEFQKGQGDPKYFFKDLADYGMPDYERREYGPPIRGSRLAQLIEEEGLKGCNFDLVEEYTRYTKTGIWPI